MKYLIVLAALISVGHATYYYPYGEYNKWWSIVID